MNDHLQEIFQTLRKNKLRTTLTGLSVSWGIFILIVLLGAGNGLKNGVMSNFGSRAVNRINISTGTTSMPYNGLKSGRNLQLSIPQLEIVENDIEESRLISPRVNTNKPITYGAEYNNYTIKGVVPDFFHIEGIIIHPNNGRFINQLDLKNTNKVIVLDKKIVETLFKNKSPLGEYVKISNVMFKVIGINSKTEKWEGASAYIPLTTAQGIFKPDNKFSQITFTVDGLETKEENDKFDETLRNILGRSLSFNPEDKQALWIENSQAEYIESQKIFGGITIFVSIIGILTLIAGIVGVSNIMLVSVKERTREIGIRKAIGAPPASILKTIILESLIITAIFGYIGMILGIGLTELMNVVMEQSGNGVQGSDGEMQMTIFKNPTINTGYAIFATVVLIISGVIAGYLPARKAVKIKPIEAMRQE
ncbi:MAG: ABC transporter permease [Bacteroidia bacterium]|nr:ABC transporter permease [Bacteroidia bacterium]